MVLKLSHLAPKIGSLLPPEIRQSVSLGDFKTKIKKWALSTCPCRLNKNVYIK